MEKDFSDNDIYSLMFHDYPDVVDVKQLTEMLSVSQKTAYCLLQENKIEHFKIGRIYKIPKIHVLQYIKVIGSLPKDSCQCKVHPVVRKGHSD
jgi:excisionase family DNA binding protein